MFAPKRIIAYVSVVLLSCGLAMAQTPFRECSNQAQTPLMVQIDDCRQLPCDLVKGKTTDMAIQFVADKDSMSNIKASVRLTIFGAQIPSDLEDERSSVCRNLMFGAYCPLDAGEDVTYHLVLDIAEHQPEVPAKMEISLHDLNDHEAVVACFVTDVRIKKRSGLLRRIYE